MPDRSIDKDFAEAKRAHQAGDRARAEIYYRKVLSQTPQEPQALYLLGALCHDAKQFEDARDLLVKSLAVRPSYAPAHAMLATVYAALNAPEDAIRHFRIVADAAPHDAGAQFNLARTLSHFGRPKEALPIFQRIYAKKPDDVAVMLGLAEALDETGEKAQAIAVLQGFTARTTTHAQAFIALGRMLQRCGRDADAVTAFEVCLRHHPQQPDALLHLGSIKFGEGNFNAAEPLFRQLVAAYPNHTKALNHLANTLLYLEKIDEAEVLGTKAYSLAPGDFETIMTYGLVLQERGKSAAAEALFRQALALNPNSAEAWNNVGMSLQFQGRPDEAIACYEKANMLKPAFAGALTNKAQSLMALGRLSQGWEIYRHRFAQKAFGANRRGYILPQWTGEATAGLKLLVWTDQGLGDELLYASMLPDLQKRDIDVVLECSERLVPLFKRSFPDLAVVPRRTPPDAAIQVLKPNAHISLAELGALFRPSIASFPARRGFLRADPDRAAAIRARYRKAAGPKPLIGVSWKSENPKTGTFKSVAPHQWRALMAAADAYFVSLQYGDDAADIEVIQDGGRVALFKDPEIDPVADVDHFAAQVAALDFVITVSNTTAHVAGGLNVPVWLLAPQGQGMLWYWFFDGAYSPWYASMRVFRQDQPGAWSRALDEIAANLKQLNLVAV